MVDDRLNQSRGQPWFDETFFKKAPMTYQESLDACCNYINKFICGVYRQWKVGICRNPHERWTNDDHGYKLDVEEPWLVMVMLYAAPSSKPWHVESTGNHEKELIKRLARHDQSNGCINRVGGGADCPSFGCPHFTYVVAR